MANLIRSVATACVVLTVGLLTPACGGGGGGAGPGGAGQGLVLVDFLQAGIDNVQINTELEFVFSEEVDPATITPASIQIREGPEFGAQVPGLFRVEGNKAIFTPNLPGLCDLSDSGLDAGRTYSVQIVGHPEEFAVKNTHGQPLNQTSSWSFATRPDTDPEKFRDGAPGVAPFVSLALPANGEQAVPVVQGNQVVLTMSENLDPCSVDATTVTVRMTETGDPVFANAVVAPNGRRSGFYSGSSTADQNVDPSLWGADVSTTLATPQTLLVDVNLVQNFDTTQIVIAPQFGEWPDNALIRIDLSFGIEDFGGQPMTPFSLAFTTENLDGSSGQYNMLFEGETPFLISSTADINTARSPGVAQGFLLITGDGDNGLDLLSPGRPDPTGGCSTDPSQANDGVVDPFDPAGPDVLLDTGPENDCVNTVDGSTAVVWEFASLLIRNGVTVRMIGENPAIILVKGDATIEAGGVFMAQGDGNGGSDISRGGNGQAGNTASAAAGGTGASGGGSGGTGQAIGVGAVAEDGWEGYGSPDGYGTQGGTGAGRGNVNASNASFVGGSGSPGGGGGGHSEAGVDGTEQGAGGNAVHGPSVGFGGGTYPGGANADRLVTPSAGSGGGSAGWMRHSSSTTYNCTAGAGGAGGGFLSITATGDINVFGTIDARGGRGGSGIAASFYNMSGGGGGGSGGGIRLLTPNDINVTNGTITAAGGVGGPGVAGQSAPNVISGVGGDGGPGRIALEDGDSTITGIETAVMVPLEGADGFYRGVFDTSRFAAGGATTVALTDIFATGPFNPNYVTPIQSDFVASMPAVSAGSIGDTGIQLEVRGFELLADGTADEGTPSAWFNIGSFQNSGSENAPAWVIGADPMSNLNGYEFIQVRFTFTIQGTVGAFDPGPAVDNWVIRFGFDN